VLHVVNGGSTAELLRGSGIAGELLPWEDILMEGPAPSDPGTAEDWNRRAVYLDGHLGIDPARYLEGMRRCLAALEGIAAHDEVVLWFEEDLFCQVHLVFLLNWLAERDFGGTRLTLICPPEPLGGTRPESLARLFVERETVSIERLALARTAWAAYAGADPRALEAVLDEDFSPWPLLRRGIVCHLQRFPSAATGLNAVETAALQTLGATPMRFPNLFRAVSSAEDTRHLGMGDVQFAACLEELSRSDHALLRIDGRQPATDGGERLAQPGAWRISATSRAAEALAGRHDRVALLGLDRWLGGVALTGDDVTWRWDGASDRLMPA
jgi:hypothetical protein